MKTICLTLFVACGLYLQAQNIPNLVACYPFSGNANDVTGNKHHGVVSGATLASDRFGSTNSAYYFNGTSDYIAINRFDSLVTQNELTLSVWAKADVNTSNCMFMLSPDAVTDRCVACAQYTGGYIIWDYGNISSGGRTLLTGYTYQSQWDHYVFIVSQSNNLKQIYKNGVQVSNTTYSSSLVNKARTLLIGGGTDSNPGNIRFHGYVDDVMIFDRALTSSEVTQLYNGYSCTTTGIPNIVACYPFCGNANDASGNKHHGVVSGATLATDRFNKPNCAYHFNGTSDYIAINRFDSIITQNELTLSVWAKADANTSNCMFMLSPDALTDRCVACAQYTGGYIIWDYGDITSNGRILLTGYTYQSQWDHYVFIVSQSNNLKQIYKNGVQISNKTYGSSLVNKLRTLLIGGGTDSNPGNIRFHGFIDDVMIFNRAITASEVTQLYNGYSCSSITGITQSELETAIKIYPNPYVDITEIHYSLNKESIVSLEVYNLIGEKLSTLIDASKISSGDHTYVLNGSTFGSNGVYLIKFTVDGNSYIQRLVKVR